MTDDDATRPGDLAVPSVVHSTSETADGADNTSCVRCFALLRAQAAFCSKCGSQQNAVAKRLESGAALGFAFYYYGALLVIAVAAMSYAKVTNDAFVAVTAGTAAIAIATCLFAWSLRIDVVPLLSRRGFSPRWYLLIALASAPIAFVVHAYVESLHRLFSIHNGREFAEFADHSIGWPVVLVVVVAPLSEELGFRGLIFTRLQTSFSIAEAFVLSSFAFALIHLSIPALVSHFPLGLYFCWLRHRSQSLWPAVFAHASHNAVVLAYEYLK